MTIWVFHCTNGSGFSGTAETSIRAEYRHNASQWTGGAGFLEVDRGRLSFTNRSMILEDANGGVVAEITLRSANDDFDTIPVSSYISGMTVQRPAANVSASGWRWRLFSRM